MRCQAARLKYSLLAYYEKECHNVLFFECLLISSNRPAFVKMYLYSVKALDGWFRGFIVVVTHHLRAVFRTDMSWYVVGRLSWF